MHTATTLKTTIEHKHTWKRINRTHGRPGRFFVQCADPACRIVRQASISYEHMTVFHTGVFHGGRTEMVSFRLDKTRKEKLRQRGIDIRKLVENFLDQI